MNTDHVVVQGNGYGNGEMWCKACGKREPISLPLGVADFCGLLQMWTDRHTACATVSVEEG